MVRVVETAYSGPSDLTGRAFRLARAGTETTVFFALPPRHGGLLSEAPDAILPYAAMLALVHGEDLDCGGMPADPVLLRNLRSALAETAAQHRGYAVPRVLNAVEVPAGAGPDDRGTGVFFSGGVDSFFSALRHRAGGDAAGVSGGAAGIGPATHAIHIYHTPEPAGIAAFDSLDSLARAAGALGLDFVPMQSNYMTADRRMHDHWADLAHGAGLSSVLHLLAGGLRQGLIGSTHSWGALLPWGSSPVIDPLWTGQRMQVVHDDAAYDRVEKTELIARHPEAMAHLNVCDTRVEGRGYVNCSSCPKCLRTMLTLDLFGASGTERAPSFDWSGYGPEAFVRVFLRTENDASFARAIRDRAAAAGRTDIAAACDTALRRGRLLRPVAQVEDSVKNSRLGRRYRGRLTELRRRLYRTAGLATKSQAGATTPNAG